MQGIPPYSAEPATIGQIIGASLYIATVALIVLGAVAWSAAPIVRDLRQRQAARVRVAQRRRDAARRPADRL